MVRAWLLSALLAGALSVAAPSLAQASQSTNWAGYAVHHSGVSFTRVQGTWREPTLSCTPGDETFSSYWVGIGGYHLGSRALEQVGTEVDCTSAGRVRAFAWYELVPAASIPVGLHVPPGDRINGSVTVRGTRVRVSLLDLTRHRRFSRLLTAPTVDVSSAEWIVEAPSDCVTTNTCVTLPLGDFASTDFSGARARSEGGHVGAISDHHWRASRINLIPSARRAVLAHQHLGPAGEAATSSLRARGSAFTVSYVPLGGRAALPAPVSAPAAASGPLTATVPPGQLEHPGPGIAAP
jgi:hypothetical protein